MRRSLALVVALLCSSCVHGDKTRSPATRVPIDVIELELAEAQRRMQTGVLSSAALTAAYLERIAAIDDAGPALAAVVEVNPHARTEAEALDRERAQGRVRGPLHGIPVLIKDNIDVAGMVNSAGSLALAEHRPRADAPLVSRLRAAGAVILGKTNLSEWANFRASDSTSGWSSRGGQTKNPYALDRNPCGSSSGTGAAIAASLAAVGVGTETDGSILCPSAIQGLVGLKPTVGLIPGAGIIPISATQDTAGPMARTVRDAALLLNGMTEGTGDYTAGLDAGALRGKRIGVLRQAMGADPRLDAITEQALASLRAAGAELIDPVEIATWQQWGEHEFEVLLYEFKDGLDRYLRESGAPVSSLAGLIAWNREHARGDAVVRAGRARAGAGEGRARRAGVRGGAVRRAAAGVGRGAGGDVDDAPARRRGRAGDGPGLADGPCPGGQDRRGQLRGGRGGGDAEPDRADGGDPRASGGAGVPRQAARRGRSAGDGLRVRTEDARSPGADVPADGDARGVNAGERSVCSNRRRALAGRRRSGRR
ncbi:amidase family protein [Nannocystis pusilla]|uniref:Amidase family protein n=1 Tax=Nannocystis pusilla TaxID=889268 RepID=A0A9X3EQI4_9BACT|nr:amidase family protein [Nannocystis pusilla]MCY1004836.1 amidase family protein [Nannocystis pusilla]